MLTLLFYIFIAVIVIEILQYIIIYGPIAMTTSLPTKKYVDFEPVSVIVYIKEQQDKLDNFLTQLINQDYPEYEIVLIHNESDDDDLEILEAFCAKHANTRLVKVANIETFWGNKKYSLTLGMKVAKYERFVFIEPVVTPRSENWLLSFTRNFSTSKKIVLGHTSINKKKRSFINQLIRFQNTYKSIDLFSWANFGKPFHGNAYNQGYNKELFFKVNGFIEQMRVPYGDEYSFINQIGTSNNVAVAYDQDSFVNLQVESKTSTWLNNVKTYDLLFRSSSFFSQLKLRFFNLCHLLFFALFTVLMSFLFNWEIVLGLFAFRYLIIYIYNYKLFKVFDDKDLIWTLPFLEIIHIFITTYYSSIHFITRKKI
ncbi:glycosyltransferase [Myroides marinus]|uniref:Glycosyltransferase, catalytic subunit of cellulose synthase and poly-beta-1,6-N-acetylglucosamine synthase n=1 Tax=Myroides marinus TaxID=703342 RepID=A0A1H6VFM9_9FLAO|nr:glycosyltransferase [Myroides marinus]MDM1360409.1 glycosyltransferase [Myroides marinus]MDM1369125.1 glycosyltransferase [Myroides marinus]MDM1372076.1 glycosyltransferase [Myroides marinus]MDM1376021.1 glycosyltransferase [Myroides marinus]MDM1379648.1 glycosyltransferase [Myroides marinus]